MQDVSNTRRSIATGDERHQGISDRLARLEVSNVFLSDGWIPFPSLLMAYRTGPRYYNTDIYSRALHAHMILRSPSRRSDAKDHTWSFARVVSVLLLMPSEG